MDASNFVKGIREFTDLLLVINSATNFPIYLFFFNQFRECFLKTFCSPACEKALQGAGNNNNNNNNNNNGPHHAKASRTDTNYSQGDGRARSSSGGVKKQPPQHEQQQQQQASELLQRETGCSAEGMTKKAWIHSNNKGSLTISDLQAASGDVYLGAPSPSLPEPGVRFHAGSAGFAEDQRRDEGAEGHDSTAEPTPPTTTENITEAGVSDVAVTAADCKYVEIEA